MCSGTEAGSYLRLIDSYITQLKAQGPSRTCNESNEEEAEEEEEEEEEEDKKDEIKGRDQVTFFFFITLKLRVE